MGWSHTLDYVQPCQADAHHASAAAGANVLLGNLPALLAPGEDGAGAAWVHCMGRYNFVCCCLGAAGGSLSYVDAVEQHGRAVVAQQGPVIASLDGQLKHCQKWWHRMQ